MKRVRTRTLLIAALLMAPAPTALLAAASCSLEGLADPPNASSSSGEGQGSAASSSSSGQGGMDAKRIYEAEHAIWYGGFIIGEDAQASGGKYVAVPMDANCGDGLSVVAFAVTVNVAGNYVIWATVSANDGNHDSFFVSVDRGEAITSTVPTVGHFVDDTVKDSLSEVLTPVQYTLEAGSHQVFFKCREPGTSLDRIWLEAAPP